MSALIRRSFVVKRWRQAPSSFSILRLVQAANDSDSQGATVAIALVVVLAVIAGTAIVAQRSFDGLLGSVFQGRAKDARLTAEAGTAFIISEWNRPFNRRLYTGLPMASWSTARNRCAAPSPNFEVANAPFPTTAASSFANGNEVTLPSSSTDTTRTFRLISATFTSGSTSGRGGSFTVTGSPVSATGTSPAISEANSRGFLTLVVEGKIYKTGNSTPFATSTVTREFIVEPKCCNRSFGGVIRNTPDLGNDFRVCDGQSNFPIGDLAIITGIGGGGGLKRNSDSNALKIRDNNGNILESITCTRPPGSSSGTCDFRSEALRTRDGNIDYEIKPITIPSPPLISAARTSFCALEQPLVPLANCTILTGLTSGGLEIESGDTINSNGSNNANCHRGRFPSGSTEAYHCIVDEIDLEGNGDTLIVDTTQRPVYFYLQRSGQDIDVGGQAAIVHRNNGIVASLAQSSRLQIRGIAKPANSQCTSTQVFDLFGNASTAMFIWAPCAVTNMKGTTEFGGIIWTNNLDFSGGGNGTINLAIPSSSGICVTGSTEVPCRVLEDTGNQLNQSAPIDWAARSINFTRFF